MTRALFPGGLETLRSFCAAPVVVAFDFDGTLAPIVADRDRARLPLRRRRLLRRLARRVPTAVISGRSHDDVRRRVAWVGARHVVGGHGSDWGRSDPDGVAFAQSLHAAVRRALDPAAGVEIEDKGTSLALHVRRAPDPTMAQAAIESALTATATSYRRIDGKKVVNLLPPGAGDKGTALRAICRLEGVHRAIFVGDDVTDEDAFRVGEGLEVLGIRVGASADSAAELHLASIIEMDHLLRRLTGIVEGSDG